MDATCLRLPITECLLATKTSVVPETSSNWRTSNKSNTALDRCRALTFRAHALWMLPGGNDEAARNFRQAISIASNASEQDRNAPCMLTGRGTAGVQCYKQSAGKLIDCAVSEA